MRLFYKNYVFFIGVFTFLAMGALFISVLGWFIGGAITVGFCGGISLLIWSFLRTTQPLTPHSTQILNSGIREIRIPLRDSLQRLRVDWKKIALLHLMVLVFINLNFFWMAQEIFERTYLAINLFYFFLAFGVSWIKTSHLRKALRLIGPRERVLLFNDQGILVPIELLNEAAMYKASLQHQPEVLILWADVQLAEVFNQKGQHPGQIRLQLTDKHQYADLMGYLAIFRTAEVDQQLEVIQTYMKSKIIQQGDA